MRKISVKTICLIYTLLVLLAAAAMTSSLSYLVLSTALLLVVPFAAIRPRSPGFNIVIDLAVIFLAPLSLEPGLARLTVLPAAATQLLATIAVLPVYYRLDLDLREHARSLPLTVKGKGVRRITTASVALLVAALTVMIIAPLVNRLVLLLSGGSLLLYLLGGLVWIWLSVPNRPFSADAVTKRIIAGTGGSATLRLTSRASVALRTCLRPADPWVQVAAPETVLRPGRGQMDINFTPPLAGQSRPRLQATAMDLRGLVRVTQLLDPLQLHIIPRAKYAAWLALKYLEQTNSGAIPEVKFRQPIARPKRGTEYHASRSYQPGDPLRDIDWKHTLKLSQLIVREFQEAGEPAAIIAVNLSVADDEEADELAFNLITAALTMARENIPTALTAYNHREVILSRGITEPMEMLRQALALVKEIAVVKFTDRYLEPVDIARIRRNISHLQQTESEPAQKLLDILNFEHHAIEEVARNHPATLALTGTARQVPAPAMILLVSHLNHDAEAVLVTGEKLARRKFTTLPVALA
jgi:uncharacterized protein (DUF58 family)